MSVLTDMKRKELKASLFHDSSDQDDLELMRAHFESHPTMPGEKAFKKRVNEILNQEEVYHLTETEKDDLAEQYANTQIRETKFNGSVVDVLKQPKAGQEEGIKRTYKDPEDNKFKLTPLKTPGQEGMEAYTLDVELRKAKDGVNIYAKRSPEAARFTKVGTVPDNFLTNNPMNVNRCSAQICVEDYSGGKLKNVSERLVVNSDIMSDDILELNDDILAALDKNAGLEQ